MAVMHRPAVGWPAARLSQPQVARRAAPTRPQRRLHTLVLALIGLVVLTIPAGIAVEEVLGRQVAQAGAQVQSELSQAIATGLDPAAAGPLILRYSQILAQPVDGRFRAIGTRERQLTQLARLRADLRRVYAAALTAQRDAFLRLVRRWHDLEGRARAAGITLDGLSGTPARLIALEATATTPADFEGMAAVLSGYATLLEQQIATFFDARSATNALVQSVETLLGEAGRYPELRLAPFHGQLDSAVQAMPSVTLASGFSGIQDRLRTVETGVRTLLAARSAAYAELAAARSALAVVANSGADVSAPTAAVNALAAQLVTAGDEATLQSITARLAAERQALVNWSVTIAAPIYRQAMNLDCETSALRMALALFGRYETDAQLFAHENPDLRPPVMGPNHTIVQWGDPYTNFVGDVNGDDSTPTGYGVYYPVILAIAQDHGVPNATGGEGYAASTIYQALESKHPVEVWVEAGWQGTLVGTWTAWDGRAVRYSFREHAVLLTGVSTGMVRVNDPWHGTQDWISKATFEASWRDFNHMAVIFR